MKKIILIVLALCFSFTLSVNAECSYKEQATLKQEAKGIKASYEEQSKMIPVEDGEVESYYFSIKLLNLSDKFSVSVTSDLDEKRVIYTSNDYHSGTLSFNHDNLSKVTTYTFKVYTTNKTNCSGDVIRTIYLNVPRYNMYSSWGFCKDNNSHLCDKYVLTDEMSIDEIRQKIDKENGKTENNNKKNDKSKDSNDKKIYNDLLIVGIGVGSILLVGGVIIFINRKKASL